MYADVQSFALNFERGLSIAGENLHAKAITCKHTPGCSFSPAAESPRSKFDASRSLGHASDDVTTLGNAWQRGKLVLNKGSAPYKSMLGGKSLTRRSSLFFRGKIRMVFTAISLLNASHLKRLWGTDKCGAVFRSFDDLPACFCMGLCLEPILPVATPVAGL